MMRIPILLPFARVANGAMPPLPATAATNKGNGKLKAGKGQDQHKGKGAAREGKGKAHEGKGKEGAAVLSDVAAAVAAAMRAPTLAEHAYALGAMELEDGWYSDDDGGHFNINHTVVTIIGKGAPREGNGKAHEGKGSGGGITTSAMSGRSRSRSRTRST